MALGPADRTAMLLERIDELTLRRHDLRGNPAALLRSVVARIDRLKDEAVTAAEYDAWARALPPTMTTPTARAPSASASSPASTSTTTGCSPRPARSTPATWCCAALALLRDAPARARARSRRAGATCSSTTTTTCRFAQALLVTLLAAEHGS